MIMIDYKDTRPIYEQITHRFEQLILRGVLKTDEQMPSVRTLAMELSINPNTIQRGYTELERRGFIYSVKGRGNFVAYSDQLLDEKRTELSIKLRGILKEANELGISKADLMADISEVF